MSRFLEYGVFVPDSKSSKDPNSNRRASSTTGTTWQWAQVGAKWVKVGPDGQPLVPTPSASLSQTTTAVTGGGNVPVENGSRSSVQQQGDPFSRTMGSTAGSASAVAAAEEVATAEGSSKKSSVEGSSSDATTALPSSGSCATAGSWETPPTTNDSYEETDGCSPRCRAGRGGLVRRGSSSGCSPRGLDPEEEEREKAERGGGTSSGGHTFDIAGGGRRGGGGGGSREDDGNSAGDAESGSTGGGGSLRSVSREMFTPTPPGTSRSYECGTGKFFGEEIDGRGGTGDGGAGARVGGGSVFESGSSVACVGERASAKGKPRRSGSGASPHTLLEPAAAVETRDVACQWDGSECFWGNIMIRV